MMQTSAPATSIGCCSSSTCAGKKKKGSAAAVIWRARLKYATRRFVVDKQSELKDEADRQRRFTEIVTPVANGIDTLGSAYRIAWFNHLYRMRER